MGYLKESGRYPAIVDAIKESCQAAGVTIEPVPVTAADYGTLGADYDALLDTRSSFGRNSSTNATTDSPLADIRKAEEELAGDALTIPLVTEARAIAVDRRVNNVVDNPGDLGLSWNMDRWVEGDQGDSSDGTTQVNPNAV